jgi:hypothetical protein
MTLAVFLAVLAQERDILSATSVQRDLSRPLLVSPHLFEWCFTTVLAPYALVASVLSQHSYRASRPVGRRMAQVPDPRWTRVVNAPEFASRRRHPMPAPA